VKALLDAIADAGNALVSVGNHVNRCPVAHVSDWPARLGFAAREAERIAKELHRLEEEALDFARRLA